MSPRAMDSRQWLFILNERHRCLPPWPQNSCQGNTPWSRCTASDPGVRIQMTGHKAGYALRELFGISLSREVVKRVDMLRFSFPSHVSVPTSNDRLRNAFSASPRQRQNGPSPCTSDCSNIQSRPILIGGREISTAAWNGYPRSS